MSKSTYDVAGATEYLLNSGLGETIGLISNAVAMGVDKVQLNPGHAMALAEMAALAISAERDRDDPAKASGFGVDRLADRVSRMSVLSIIAARLPKLAPAVRAEADLERQLDQQRAAPLTPSPDAHGPYVPCFIGTGTWAGILEELPAHLVGKSVWVTTTPPVAPAAPAPRRAREPDWQLAAKAAGRHGVRYRTNSALEQFLADIGSPPTPVSANTLDKSYDRGRRDMLNALLAPNKALAEQLAKLHEREPDPEGRMPFDVCVWVNGVAEQIGIKTLEEMLRVSESQESGEAGDAT